MKGHVSIPKALCLLGFVVVVFATGKLPAAEEHAPSEAPIILGARHQLFLDDYLIASMKGLRRTVESAQKFPGNPVLWPTEPWEPSMATVYGSVIREAGKFKIWYKSGMGVGYAESDDGMQWRKPRLDCVLIDGERSNILFRKKSKKEGPEAFPYYYELFGVHRDDANAFCSKTAQRANTTSVSKPSPKTW